MKSFEETFAFAMNIGVAHGRVGGQVLAVEAKALYETALTAPKSTDFVELGCYKGRTSLMLAAAAAERNGRLTSIDNFKYRRYGTSCPHCVGMNLAVCGLRSDIIVGDTSTVPPALAARGRVGLLFIDSDHRDEAIERELTAWLPLIVPRGLIVLHDYEPATWPTLPALLARRLPGWPLIRWVDRIAAFRKPA